MLFSDPIVFTLVCIFAGVIIHHFLWVKPDTWLDFYVSFRYTYKKHHKAVMSKLSKDGEVSEDMIRYISQFLTLYEDLVFDVLRSSCMDTRTISRRDLNRLRQRVAIFINSLAVYSYLENLESINLLFLKEHRKTFLHMSFNLIADAYTTSSPAKRRQLIGNKLVKYLEDLFEHEVPFKRCSASQLKILIDQSDLGMMNTLFPSASIYK